MELLTYKDDRIEYTYYLDKNGEVVRHGEQKYWHRNGQLWEHFFRYHGKWHGEFKEWDMSGKLIIHVFRMDGNAHPFIKMNEQEKLFFQIKYPGFRFFED